MNTLGKWLVGAITVFSIFLAAFTVAVYSQAKDWKAKQTQLQQQVSELQRSNGELQAKKDELTQTLEQERNAYNGAIAKLTTQVTELAGQREELERQQASLVEQRSEAIAGIDAAHKTLEALRGEVSTLRDQTLAAQRDKDSAFQEMVRLTDERNHVAGELKRLEGTNRSLVAQAARFKKLLESHSIDPTAPADGPPKVDGEVLASRDNGLIEISIGSDDGLRSGHTLEVFRADKYLGRVEVLQTAPDKAVAKILRDFLKAPIERGDRVATRLR